MSVSSEVRRTLVKSPPELWAELSDPLALARHLDELGEIRITGTVPERIVDWEAASAHGAQTTGRIEIEPSGWGTRVTLSASRQIQSSGPDPAAEAISEPAAAQQPQPPATVSISESPPAPAPAAASQPAPAAVSAPAFEAVSDPVPACNPDTTPESSPLLDAEIVASAPLKTFWARLFRRRRARPQQERSIGLQAPIEAETDTLQPEPDATADEPAPASQEPAAPAPQPALAPPAPATEQPQPAVASKDQGTEQPQPAPAPDLAAELAELEQQTTAVLTGVLDRLGAAHHRPFSRA
jgi:hypothetical protein